MIPTLWYGSLLESLKLILLAFYLTYGNVVRLEILHEFLPGDLSSIVGTSILVGLPPVLCCTLELARCKRHLLLVITMGYV